MQPMATQTVIGQVEAFQPGVDGWAVHREYFFVIDNIGDDCKKLAIFLTVVGAKTYSLLSDLLAPDKPVTRNWKPKPVIIVERFHFHQREDSD